MKKKYEEPMFTVRNYVLPSRNVVMTSDPSDGTEGTTNDLNDGDDYDIFG